MERELRLLSLIVSDLLLCIQWLPTCYEMDGRDRYLAYRFIRSCLDDVYRPHFNQLFVLKVVYQDIQPFKSWVKSFQPTVKTLAYYKLDTEKIFSVQKG